MRQIDFICISRQVPKSLVPNGDFARWLGWSSRYSSAATPASRSISRYRAICSLVGGVRPVPPFGQDSALVVANPRTDPPDISSHRSPGGRRLPQTLGAHTYRVSTSTEFGRAPQPHLRPALQMGPHGVM